MNMKSSVLATLVAGLLLTSGLARAASDAPASGPGPLQPFALSADGWQLDGETDRIGWNLNVDPATASAGSELILALETAVSVMPEASRLTVQVNGRDIGLIQLGGIARPVTVPLPAGTLAPGWNRITLSALQRHRVDCSLTGTYELWTRVDPARSGFRALGTMVPSSGVSLLTTASPDSNGALRLRLRMMKPSNDALTAGLSAAGIVARLAGNLHPVVDMDNSAGVGAGIDIAIGSRADLMALGLPEAIISAAASMPQIIPPLPGGRPTLVLVAGIRGYGETMAGLQTLADGKLPPESRPSVSGTEPQTVSFADAGIASSQFSGRAWTEKMNVSLPADALIADYDNVTMTLDAGYAPGLAPDNLLSVFVDDRLAATVKLGNASGDFLQNRQIEVPLSAFHPGNNQIRLQANVAAPEDADCDASVQIGGAPRFLALDSTRFTFPRLARMAHLPDLGATLALGRAGAGDDSEINLALGKNDSATIGAAATLFARMAVAADRLPRLKVVDAAKLPVEGDVIAIGTAGDLPTGLIRQSGVDPISLRRVETTPIAMIRATEPTTTGSLSGTTLAMVIPASAKQEDLRDAWRSRLKVDDSPVAQLRKGIDDLVGSLASAVGLAPADEDLMINPSTRLVVAQANGSSGLLTLVTAANSTDLTAGVYDITAPDGWRHLGGRATTLDARTGEVTSLAASHPSFVATGPVEFGNLRLVAAAWLSLNQTAYGAMLVAAAIAFGLMTWHRVRRAGVRTAP